MSSLALGAMLLMKLFAWVASNPLVDTLSIPFMNDLAVERSGKVVKYSISKSAEAAITSNPPCLLYTSDAADE